MINRFPLMMLMTISCRKIGMRMNLKRSHQVTKINLNRLSQLMTIKNQVKNLCLILTKKLTILRRRRLLTKLYRQRDHCLKK